MGPLLVPRNIRVVERLIAPGLPAATADGGRGKSGTQKVEPNFIGFARLCGVGMKNGQRIARHGT
jgi:hypothetical protein